MSLDNFNYTRFDCESVEQAKIEFGRMLEAGGLIRAFGVLVLDNEKQYGKPAIDLLVLDAKHSPIRVSALMFETSELKEEVLGVLNEMDRTIYSNQPALFTDSDFIESQDDMDAITAKVTAFQQQYGFHTLAFGMSFSEDRGATLDMLCETPQGKRVPVLRVGMSVELFNQYMAMAKSGVNPVNPQDDDVSSKIIDYNEVKESVTVH